MGGGCTDTNCLVHVIMVQGTSSEAWTVTERQHWIPSCCSNLDGSGWCSCPNTIGAIALSSTGRSV